MDSKTFNKNFIAKVITDKYTGLVGYSTLKLYLNDKFDKVTKKAFENKRQISRFKPFRNMVVCLYSR